MKKFTISLLGFIFIITSLFSCDKEQENSQAAFVYVQHYYTGRRAPAWERVNIPRIWVYADITGNPLPDFNYVQIDNLQFSDNLYFSYYEGTASFDLEDDIWLDSISEPSFSPLTIKINTSSGEIEGSINVPDTIKTLSIDAPDTIPLNTSITISWTGSNADYYYVYYYHCWAEEEGGGYGYLGYSRDTLIEGNSVILEGSRFLKDGDISEIEICPINGVFPEAGAKANMAGDGFGYLYLENRSKSSDRTIGIGKGINYSFFEVYALKSSSVNNTRAARSEIIKKSLGL